MPPVTNAETPRANARGTTDYHTLVTHGRPTLRIATYNIHRCRGIDGRTRPERTAAVLRAIGADVVALQEVVGPGPRGGGHAEELGALLGRGWVMASASHLRRRRQYPGLVARLHLGHIYCAGKLEILELELPRTRLSLVASDHLPLVADVRIG